MVLCFGVVRPYKGVDVLVEAFRAGRGRGAVGGRAAARGVDGAPAAARARRAGALRAALRERRRSCPPSSAAPTCSCCRTAASTCRACCSPGSRSARRWCCPTSAASARWSRSTAPGVLVPPEDPDALAAAIARAARRPTRERRRLEERARAAAAGPYSWDRIAERTLSLYERGARVRVVFMAQGKRSAARALDWLAVEGVDVVAVVAARAGRVHARRAAGGPRRRAPRAAARLARRSCTPSPPGDVDLVISFLFWNRIREPLISLGRVGCLNFHPAPLPDLRGVGGYNVAVLEGLREWGVSCHFVDERLRHRRPRRGGALPDRPGHRDGAVARPGQPGAAARAVRARDAARARRRGAAAHAAGRGPLRDRARSSRSCGVVRPGDDLDREAARVLVPALAGRGGRGGRPAS